MLLTTVFSLLSFAYKKNCHNHFLEVNNSRAQKGFKRILVTKGWLLRNIKISGSKKKTGLPNKMIYIKSATRKPRF